MPWGNIKPLNHQMVVLDLHKISIHTIPSIPGFIQLPMKVYHEGGLKEIHLSYTTIAASPEGVTGCKSPLPLSVGIPVLIYCLYFTQEPSSKWILMLALITMICTAHYSAHCSMAETIEMSSYPT